MKFNIRHKLIAFAFCIALVVGGSISLYTMHSGRQQILLTFEKDARATADLIARTIANELFFLDVASVRMRLESSRANADIRYTIVTDAKGFVLTDGTDENRLGGQLLADSFVREMLRAEGTVVKAEGDIFKIGVPILMPNGSRIGYLLAGFSFIRADEIVRSATWTSIYITTLFIGIGTVLAFFFSARFSRSILSIVRAAKSIGEGQLDTRLDVRRSDELGTLAGSINQMAQALKESYQDLEEKIAERTRDLAELYTALTPIVSANADDLMQNVAERLKEATHADAALIRIFDHKTQSYLYPTHSGFPSSYLEATRQVAPDSAIGTSFSIGEAIISANIREDPRLKGKKQLEAGFASCAFLPLRVSGELYGIIHLASRKLGHFNEGQKDHLMAIARQMGVATENSGLYETLRQKAEELRKNTLELEKANKAKDEFLSTMSHELRTPLNVVIGYAAMLKDGMAGSINPEQEKALGKILTRANNQLEMINRMLQATQIGVGELRVTKQVVNLNELLAGVRSNYNYPTGKEIRFHWEYSPDLPFVRTDGDKVKHILQNIIANAVKFTPVGSITISVRHIPRLGVIEFTVSDTGVGIPKAMLSVIFEMFRQVDGSVRREFEGVGLGLYIVKQLTELLEGKVEVDSEEGKGSTFTITIPVEMAIDDCARYTATGELALLH